MEYSDNSNRPVPHAFKIRRIMKTEKPDPFEVAAVILGAAKHEAIMRRQPARYCRPFSNEKAIGLY